MNHITIAGRVDTDPVRKEVNNTVLCSFRLASGRSGHKTGRLWIDIETWGPLAGTSYQHLTKGRTIIMTGRLTQKQWADASGDKRSRYLITATAMDIVITKEGPSEISPQL